MEKKPTLTTGTEPKEITFEKAYIISVEDAEKIFKMLEELPFKTAAPIIQLIQMSVRADLKVNMEARRLPPQQPLKPVL